ncbi:hypothetical protein, partial, partial [Parasitella parasitica]
FSLDLLCIQKSHAISDVQDRLNMQLQASSSLWTPHCGIVSFNPLISLHSLDIDIEQRILACTVTHANALFPPITLVNIYAPATYSHRVRFFQQLLDIPIFNSMSASQDAAPEPDNTTPMLILGDFNYHAAAYINDSTLFTNDTSLASSSNAQRSWAHFINSRFFECTHSRGKGPLLPTFRRGSTQSTIDYIYASPFLYQHLHSSKIDFMSSSWTDHALLRTCFIFSSDRQGPGLWRANPHLARNQFFIDQLYSELDAFFLINPITNPNSSPLFPSSLSPQEQWDTIKLIIKQLQRKRNKILRQSKNSRITSHLLPIVERQIGQLQSDTAQNEALRAGRHWRENGEKSAGYLKRTIARRALKRNITELLHPHTNTICTTPSSMQDAAINFYTLLYYPDPVDQNCIQGLCATIPPQARIVDTDHALLEQPFTIIELLQGTERTSLSSSPGVDGIPYAIYNIMLQHPDTAKLAVTVFNDALLLGIFPASWLKTVMCLPPQERRPD